jgi:hypothetical protein
MVKDIVQKEKKHWKGVYFTYCPNAKCSGTHEETNPPATPHGACLKCHKWLYNQFKTFPNEAAFNAWMADELSHPHEPVEPKVPIYDNNHVHETNTGNKPNHELPSPDKLVPDTNTSHIPVPSPTPSPSHSAHSHSHDHHLHIRRPHDLPSLHNDVDQLQDRQQNVPHLNSFPSPSSRGASPSQLSRGDRKRIVLKVEGERYGEDFIAGSLDDIQHWASEKAQQRHLNKWTLLRNGRSKLMNFESVQPDDEYVLVAGG